MNSSDEAEFFRDAFGGDRGFLKGIGAKAVQALFAALRRAGAVRVFKWHLILGFDQVQEVFSRSKEFPVPHSAKTDTLGWKPPFLLAMGGDVEPDPYHAERVETLRLWPNDTVPRDEIRELFVAQLETLHAGSDTPVPIDAIQDYMLPVFLDIAIDHFELDIEETEKCKFVQGLMVVSKFFFASPFGTRKLESSARDAYRYVSEIIERSAPELDQAKERSRLLGMILGFIPTSLNGNVRALETFLNDPDAKRLAAALLEAEAAAQPLEQRPSQEPSRFLLACHEALRMNYILPGLWRVAAEPYELETLRRPYRIKEGHVLLVSNQTAMFDPAASARPKKFDPTRRREASLIYGHQRHACVGYGWSDVILEESLRPLFSHRFKQVGRTAWRGNFPWRLKLELGTADA